MISSIFEPAATGRLQANAAFDFTRASVDPMKNFYRAGIKTGEYTSGSATILLNGYNTWPPRV